MKRLGVLLSGRGSNFQALLAATREGRIDATVALVVSNVVDAPGLLAARTEGLTSCVVDHRGREREAHDAEILALLEHHGVDLVCLAGYMRVLGAAFVAARRHRIVNVHPSLLPAFPGREAQRQALEHGVLISGATVHLVDQGLDSGPIVAQCAVAVEPNDTTSSLTARILAVEHQIYPAAVARLVSEHWQVVGRRVVFPSRT